MECYPKFNHVRVLDSALNGDTKMNIVLHNVTVLDNALNGVIMLNLTRNDVREYILP